ncbi:MAG TPA: glucans biosynthesis glucosyltransferase MdoH [Burkholderiaceae bacterium]|nr:glucans biosynthesis glucosyltransferase MdoH [Burkholderiaceae bacterium]
MTTVDRSTAPPVRRAPMRARPWFGLGRGLLFALWPGLRVADAAVPHAAWQRAAGRRRRMLLAGIALLGAAVVAWQVSAAPESPTLAWAARVALSTLLFAWLGSGFVTALMGAWVMLRGDRHALAPGASNAPIDAAARTAVIMPICNEDVATVFAGLQATCQSLAATGALPLFDFYVLSDSADPGLRAAELHAWQQLRETLGDKPVREGGRVFYRWRRRRTRRKAGNVADFCRRWGAGYRYMVVLDADSIMRGDTLVSMVRLMEHNPRAGIVQTLPEGLRPQTLHARLQQFGSGVTGRLFALGMAYWQLGESHYWGHNAILRVAPFMRHCALAPIAGRGGLSGEILSHDFVEAALMRRGGYEVWLAPQLQGSWEQHPSSLLEELQRDRRWCQGNLQNARLIAEPGLRAVHRTMLAVGALSYLMAPVWLAYVALGLAFGADGGQDGRLWMLTLVLLVLPRVLGVMAVQLRGEQRRFGGHARLLGSAGLELLLSTLQAPVRMLAHSAFVVGALTGLRLDWKSPSRAAAHVAWGDALRRVGALTLPPLALALLLVRDRAAGGVPYLMLPLLLPLLLAVPFAIWTGSPGRGQALRRAGLLGMAEGAPQRAAAVLAGRADPRGAAPGTGRVRLPHARQAAISFAAMAGVAALAMFAPRLAFGPEPSVAVLGEQQRLAMQRSTVARIAAAPIALARVGAPRKPPRSVPYKPARMIDDAVRMRAFEAVARAQDLG